MTRSENSAEVGGIDSVCACERVAILPPLVSVMYLTADVVLFVHWLL